MTEPNNTPGNGGINDGNNNQPPPANTPPPQQQPQQPPQQQHSPAQLPHPNTQHAPFDPSVITNAIEGIPEKVARAVREAFPQQPAESTPPPQQQQQTPPPANPPQQTTEQTPGKPKSGNRFADWWFNG